jgi:hypothetical protein
MGGFTRIQLEDCSEENIAKHNARLQLYGVAKQYHFYSINDIIFEYEYFKAGEGEFKEHLFPKDKINSLEDFRKYWSPEALGEVFVPQIGMLCFDCYFGRTSQRAMKNIVRYLVDNHRAIKYVGGSFSTLLDKAATKLEKEILTDSIREKY